MVRLASDSDESGFGLCYIASDVAIYLFSVICFVMVAANWVIFGNVPFRNLIDIYGIDLLEIALLAIYSAGFVLISVLRARHLKREFQRRVQSERVVYDLAHSDQLTGLANRRRFLGELDEALTRPVEPNRVHAVLLLDLNGFKTINDGFGHSAGDEVLREVGHRLQRALRRGEGIVARLGGDEFAIVVQNISEADVEGLAQRVFALFDRPVRIYNVNFAVDASLGAALAERDGVTSSDLIRRADLALYKSKANGLPRSFTLFTPSLESGFWSNLELCEDFETALEEGRFEPYFQPILNLESCRVEAFEALARWHHPRLGVIAPEVFLPVAHALGKMPDLTDRILRQAARLAVRWPDDIRLAMNVSAEELKAPSFSARILSILDGSGLPPHKLEIEISEAVGPSEIAIAATGLQSLLEAGVQFSLDDFASEDCTLPVLGMLPFSRMKIDRSVIQADASDRFEVAVLKTSVELGRTLEIKVTAEGVETPDQLRRLREHGCTSCQGFLFTLPLKGEEIGAFLASDRICAEVS
ncbi:putative bifunctional diguanylate cyclase/phosphodiesterase [Amorphus sp. 3PC139-8]|uniref:putative bifunctional diguanylate cyclase/phosphodiesterase n=1 Tax=Amorphus sp. 3PC139-8 TaxID=2735676 RepID=UPI00345D10CB